MRSVRTVEALFVVATLFALQTTSCSSKSGGSGGGSGGQGGKGGATTGNGGSSASGGATSSGGQVGSGGTTITPACTPSCTNKTCGSDGCEGTCGGCPPAQMCGANGTCQIKSGSGILIDASAQLTPISPDIYGIGFADDESAKVTTLNRSGGD